MKNQTLDYYDGLIAQFIRESNFVKAKACGEDALKKMPLLSFSPEKEFGFYCNMGRIYYNLIEFSRAIDMYYKASLLASRHHFPLAKSVYVSCEIGSNLMLLKNIGPAIQNLKKAEDYFEKYGYGEFPMDKMTYIYTFVCLAYCYLHNAELPKVRDIIYDKLGAFKDDSSLGFFPLDHNHLKGEYLMAVNDYAGAKAVFKECVDFSNQKNFLTGALEARIHFAVMDMLESHVDEAIKELLAIKKESGQAKITYIYAESELLLSKCYFLKNMPDKAAAAERRIKPVLNKLDVVWLYEKSRELEQLFRRLQSVTPQKQSGLVDLPEVLKNTINTKYENSPYRDIIGTSTAMQDVFKILEKIAPTDLPVLIQGETGTGKELIASALHQNSLRKNENWLAFNCGALTESLVESELFGHTKGAFTGAVEVKKGYVELASNGTLFMDEIADMSLKIQQKLLRVLEEKQVWRIGAENPVPINTRFIFASNQNIEELVRKKMFREDLYYRINAIMINLPALRERREDITLLLKYFLVKYTLTGRPMEITQEALTTAVNYNWPGNIREMKNEIKRICALNKESVLLETPMFSPVINAYRPQEPAQTTGQTSFKELRDAFEKQVLTETLRKCNGNIVQAARTLKYNRSALYRKLRLLGIITLTN
ncbi:MAG: sigma-54-dependent Fis family transcriptional regulator [Planctomycetes bacterium]|nr:sigma-54-dependent Fis family transcriptional regulator [Planctomycetota bacterium]